MPVACKHWLAWWGGIAREKSSKKQLQDSLFLQSCFYRCCADVRSVSLRKTKETINEKETLWRLKETDGIEERNEPVFGRSGSVEWCSPGHTEIALARRGFYSFRPATVQLVIFKQELRNQFCGVLREMVFAHLQLFEFWLSYGCFFRHVLGCVHILWISVSALFFCSVLFQLVLKSSPWTQYVSAVWQCLTRLVHIVSLYAGTWRAVRGDGLPVGFFNLRRFK